MNNNIYINILFAYLINLSSTSLLHFTAYRKGSGWKADIIHTIFFSKVDTIKDDCSVFVYYIKFLISGDYWSAHSIKHNIHREHELGEFIKNSNSYNLFLSLFLILLYLILLPVNDVMKYFLMIRVVSRSFEIMFAFYKDVIDKKEKISDLNASDRLSLATKSYFEIIINNTLIYTLITNKNLEHNLFKSIGISTFTEINFQKYYNNNIFGLENIFIVIQIFTSLCLISLALAKYIGDKQS